jgi:inner membrane protein
METKTNKERKFSQSLTLKAIIIATLILLMLIPNMMIQNLISERQERSRKTIERINEKWSSAQTLCGPVLTIPYTTTTVDSDKKVRVERHEWHITPEILEVSTQLFPEERYYGIYKTILYKSISQINGQFSPVQGMKTGNNVLLLNEAYLSLGISDLRGVTQALELKWNDKVYCGEAGGSDKLSSNRLIVRLKDGISLDNKEPFSFECQLSLNGSSYIEFVPIGQTTKVKIEGKWNAPGFFGSFSPDYTFEGDSFKANWSILSFNRNIPESWKNNLQTSVNESSFGVNLVDTVDHYQQNMRSAKYSLMFIVLTFVVFFFVEVLAQKRIHPVQYLLVGIALILFYSLLLSISEQTGFMIAYLIASVATVSLISVYAYSIFKNASQTGILALILSLLYVFLYVVLQLEDVALLIGSIGLFVILGVIMFLSRKIKWYKQEIEE